MKVIISTDPHSKISNIESLHAYLDKLKSTESQAQMSIICGDIFNDHSLIRTELFTIWCNFLQKITIPYFLLVGNHDKISPSSSIHALEAFKFVPQVTVIGPGEAVVGQGPYGDMTFMAHNTVEDFKQLAQSLRPGKYLFCHQLFQGAKFDNGFYSPDGVPIEYVSSQKLVISGDVHQEQQIGNVWYPGSPFPMSFADSDQGKGIWLFDTETGERSKIKLNLPLYITKSFQDVREIIPWLQTQDNKNKIRINIIDTKNNIQMFQESKEWEVIKKEYNVTPSPQYTDIIEYSNKIDDSLTPVQMLTKYVNEVMQLTEINREKLLEKSKSYLK